MPAAVYKGNHTITVEEVPVPELHPHQVLLAVSHCGICGSDLHLMMDDWGIPGSTGGHEYSGVVAAVGDDVDGWAVGDRAVGGPGRGCGQCARCATGRPQLCAHRTAFSLAHLGAFASFKVVDGAALYPIPDGLDLRTAALTEPVAVALRGVRKTDPGVSSRVLVTGGGPIGLLTVAVLRALGVGDITVSEPGEGRRALAQRVGATSVITPDRLEHPRMPMEIVAEPFTAAIECSGNPQAMEGALANLDRAGTLVLSGTGMRRPRFDTNRIILNELTIAGTIEYTPGDYEDALELLAAGRLPTRDLIEPDDQPLTRLQWAMEQLRDGALAGKVMVVPDA
jgi:(R,R)-butanediol dehydrogenase/meso-butanediol dehydrogenase/diacetyl reductase